MLNNVQRRFIVLNKRSIVFFCYNAKLNSIVIAWRSTAMTYVHISHSNNRLRCTCGMLYEFYLVLCFFRTIRHPNILVLKGWLREPRLGIVTQWCDNLSLYKHLHVNEPPTKFSTSETVNISKQIAQGMG